MTGEMSLVLPLTGGFAAGAVLGAAYIRLLALNVALYAKGAGWRLALALHCGRLALIAAAMWGAVQWGGGALLAALGGFLAARALMIRRSEP